VNGNDRTPTRVIVHFKNLTRLNSEQITKAMREDAILELAEEEEEDVAGESKENSEST